MNDGLSDQEFPDPSFAARRRAKKEGPNPMLIVVGVLALAIVAGGIWFATKGRTSPEQNGQKVAEQVDPKPVPVLKEIEPRKNREKEKEKPKEVAKKKVEKKKAPAPMNDPPPPVEIADEFKKPRTFRGHEAPVKGLAISPDGKHLLTTSDDLNVFSWVPEKDRPSKCITLKSPPGVAVAFLAEGKEAVAVDGGFITVIDLHSHDVVKQMVTPDGGFQGLAVAADGKHFLTCSTDGRLRWWDVTKETPERTMAASERSLECLALASDGKTAIAGARDGMLSLWDVTTGNMLKKWAGHKGGVTSLAISPDKQRAVTGGEDKLAKVWDIEKGTLLKTMIHQTGAVTALAYSADGRTIFTASDATVRSWDAITGDPLQWALKLEAKAVSLALDPKDRFLVAGLDDGSAQLALLPAVRPGKLAE